MGLVLDTLKIQNITDDVGYLNSIGRIQGARVRMDAAIAEAKATADAAVQQAMNWRPSEIGQGGRRPRHRAARRPRSASSTRRPAARP